MAGTSFLPAGAYSGGVGEPDSPDDDRLDGGVEDGLDNVLDNGAVDKLGDEVDPGNDRPRGFAPSAGVRVLRAVRVPGTLLLIGIVLSFIGPVPGLAAFLIIGAGLATVVIGMTALVGG
jgi:hypothetical protein